MGTSFFPCSILQFYCKSQPNSFNRLNTYSKVHTSLFLYKNEEETSVFVKVFTLKRTKTAQKRRFSKNVARVDNFKNGDLQKRWKIVWTHNSECFWKRCNKNPQKRVTWTQRNEYFSMHFVLMWTDKNKDFSLIFVRKWKVVNRQLRPAKWIVTKTE